MARVLFFQNQIYAYPGVYYLCGALKATGHTYKVVAGTQAQQAVKAVREFKPHLVAMPCLTGLHLELLTIASQLKEQTGCKILLGGAHPTLFPQVLNHPAVDFICRGEGEQAVCDLATALENQLPTDRIGNIISKNNGQWLEGPRNPLINPLDEVPFPDYSIYKDNPVIAADTFPLVYMVRGCPYSCSYCHNSRQKELFKGLGKYYRCYSVQRALAEVDSAIENYPQARAVLFGGDTLGSNFEWMSQLVTSYSSRHSLPYICNLRPEFITEDVARLLGDTNCHMLAFGLESGSERIRKDLLGRNYSNAFIKEVTARLHRYNVPFRTYNIVGFPTESFDEMIETLQMNIDIKTKYPWCSIYTPYPATELTDYCIENGFLSDNFFYDDVPPSFFNDTILKNVDRDLILNFHSFFQIIILFPQLLPLLKPLLKKRHNRIYRLLSKVAMGYVCLRSENRSVKSLLKYAQANFRLFK